MKWFHLLIIVILISSCVTADTARFDPPDSRLNKKISLEVSHAKLVDVTNSLSEQSSITVKAGTSARDWKVREQHVTVYARDVPLSTVLDQLTILHSFYLSREGEKDKWTYTIWQDKKSRDLETEMVIAEKEALAQRIKDTRQSALDNARKALGMSSEDAMKLREKDPLTAFMGGTKTGRAFSTLFSSLESQYPTEYDLMMRGKPVSIPISGMPANMRKAVGDALSGGLAKAIKDAMGKEGVGLVPSQFVFYPVEGFIDQLGGLTGLGGYAEITGMKPGSDPNDGRFGGEMMSSFEIQVPGSGWPNMYGEMMLKYEESSEAGSAFEESLAQKMNDPGFQSEMFGYNSPTEKNIPTDPELTREIEIKANAMLVPPETGDLFKKNAVDQGKSLAEISRATGWPVFFESFSHTTPIAKFVRTGKQPVYNVLIALEKAGFKWERGDGTLRIRPIDWATKRSYEIPESFMTYYKDLFEKQGGFSLDDVAGIANSLTDEQIQNTFMLDPDLNFLWQALEGSGMISGPRDTLRLYATLDKDQKQALNTENGLPFNQFTDAQWDKLNTIITDKLGGVYVTDGNFRLKPLPATKTKPKSPRREFTFETTVQVENDKKPRKISESFYLLNKKQLDIMRENTRKAEEAAKATELKEPDKSNQAQEPATTK